METKKEVFATLLENINNATKDTLTEIFNTTQKALVENSLLTEDRIHIQEELKKHKTKKFTSTDSLKYTYSRLVMPEDLNPAETLFGGRLLQWIDEVGCIYVWDQWKQRKIVTTEIQNVYFLCSPKAGDIVKFYVETLEERRASVWLRVVALNVTAESNPVVIDCHIRFAFIEKLKR